MSDEVEVAAEVAEEVLIEITDSKKIIRGDLTSIIYFITRKTVFLIIRGIMAIIAVAKGLTLEPNIDSENEAVDPAAMETRDAYEADDEFSDESEENYEFDGDAIASQELLATLRDVAKEVMDLEVAWEREKKELGGKKTKKPKKSKKIKNNNKKNKKKNKKNKKDKKLKKEKKDKKKKKKSKKDKKAAEFEASPPEPSSSPTQIQSTDAGFSPRLPRPQTPPRPPPPNPVPPPRPPPPNPRPPPAGAMSKPRSSAARQNASTIKHLNCDDIQSTDSGPPPRPPRPLSPQRPSPPPHPPAPQPPAPQPPAEAASSVHLNCDDIPGTAVPSLSPTQMQLTNAEYIPRPPRPQRPTHPPPPAPPRPPPPNPPPAATSSAARQQNTIIEHFDCDDDDIPSQSGMFSLPEPPSPIPATPKRPSPPLPSPIRIIQVGGRPQQPNSSAIDADFLLNEKVNIYNETLMALKKNIRILSELNSKICGFQKEIDFGLNKFDRLQEETAARMSRSKSAKIKQTAATLNYVLNKFNQIVLIKKFIINCSALQIYVQIERTQNRELVASCAIIFGRFRQYLDDFEVGLTRLCEEIATLELMMRFDDDNGGANNNGGQKCGRPLTRINYRDYDDDGNVVGRRPPAKKPRMS